MDILDPVTALAEAMGEPRTALLFGMATGFAFGLSAQRSQFCLRSASIEFARGRLGPRMAIWLLTFSTAVLWIQAAGEAGLFDSNAARMMAVPGSWSGAMIGGLIFGFGMVLTRGCSGRLVVLAGTGNLRSIVAGMVFAITAQVSLHGALAPVRQYLAALWITPHGRNVDLETSLGLPDRAGVAFGVAVALLALGVSYRARTPIVTLIWACGAGLAVAVGWVLTFGLAQVAFDPIAVNSVTYSGPSADALMYVLDSSRRMSFEVGLVPGTLAGAFLGGLVGRELQWQSFSSAGQMGRSLIGGAMMGFGGMLAGGCAIGAGLTGTSIFVGTAWLATACFFIGAFAADWLFDRPAASARAPVFVAR